MPSKSSYFENLTDQKMNVRDHGFDHFPSDEKLVDYLFETNGKIDLVANAMGVRVERDVCGRLHLAPTREVW